MALRGKLTTRQAAAALGVSVPTLRRMVGRGELAETRLSERVILYSEADVGGAGEESNTEIGEAKEVVIYINQSNQSGEVYAKRFPPTGSPENTGRTYAVRRCGPVWEVRCIMRSRGKVTDQLVDCGLSEQEAEAMARELADPSMARDRGKRVLEELVEDGE